MMNIKNKTLRQVKPLNIIFIILGLLMLICLLPEVSAIHSICGKVNPTEDGTTPIWKSVRIYYPIDPANYNSCQISPANNAYCCDSENIPSHTWGVGNVINVTLYDSGDGYYAYPVAVTTTAEGYDQPADMQLISGINILSSEETVYTNDTFYLNITTRDQYIQYIKYVLDGLPEVTLCSSCNFTEIYLSNLSEGEHVMTIYSNNGNYTISRPLTFTITSLQEEVNQSITPENPQSDASSGGIEKKELTNQEQFYDDFYDEFNNTEYKIKFAEIPEGKKLLFKIEDKTISIYEILLSLNKQVKEVKISLKREIPPKLDYPINTLVYQYLIVKIENIEQTDIQEGKIKLRIKNRWLEKNLIKTVFLSTYSEGKWNLILPTDKQIRQEETEFIFLTNEINPFFILGEQYKTEELKQSNLEKVKLFIQQPIKITNQNKLLNYILISSIILYVGLLIIYYKRKKH